MLQNQSGTGTTWCHTFNQNLGVGAKGEEVKNLQQALSFQGFKTEMFDGVYSEVTAAAVSQFQLKYKEEILTSSGLDAPTGYFGPASRRKMNSLYGCNTTQPVPSPTPIPMPPKTYIGADLSVANFELNADGPKALFCNSGSVQLNNFPLEIWINDVTRNFDLAGVLTPGACQTHQWYYATWGLSFGGSYHGVVSVDPYGVYAEINETNNKVSANYGTPIPYPTPTPTSGLTVVSPNGGENWQKGTTQRIGWSWKTDMFVGQQFAIYLTPVNWSSTNPQLVITTGIAGTSYYDWEVGKAKNLVTGGSVVPSQSYYIDICAPSNFGGRVCDRSDSFFWIRDPDTQPVPANFPPSISGVSGPTSLKIGETGTWVVKASDPENGLLSYYVNWGEFFGDSAVGAVSPVLLSSQTATFTHSYAVTGTYYPKFRVTDNAGQSNSASLSVVVGGGGNGCENGAMYNYLTGEPCAVPATITPSIISSNPLTGAIDARRPVNSDGSSYTYNLGAILTMSGNVSMGNLKPTDFSIKISDGSSREVVNLGFSDNPNLGLRVNQVNVVSQSVSSSERILLTHKPSGSSICIGGILPGDIDQSGVVTPADILEMIDIINGVRTAPSYVADFDRNGVVNNADRLALIDYVNANNGKTLPACPAL